MLKETQGLSKKGNCDGEVFIMIMMSMTSTYVAFILKSHNFSGTRSSFMVGR